MLALAIETATQQGGIALDRVFRQFDKGMVHGRDLAPAIDAVLKQLSARPADVDLIVCDIGPGSYTGLRVGLAYARTMGWSLSKPVVGIVSLDVLAQQYVEGHPNLPEGSRIVPALDAKWNQVYHGTYEVRAGSAHRLNGPCADAPGEAFRQASPAIVFGDSLGGLLTPGDIPPSLSLDPDPAYWFPHPLVVLRLGILKFTRDGADNLLGLEPLYLRPTEAELNRLKSSPS